MVHRQALLVVLFCSFVFSTCSLLYGQSNGSFSGTVTDKTGSVISGAIVRVTSQGTAIRETKTDDTGTIDPIAAGAFYTMHVESQGSGG
jgi:hypothetical protein